MDGWLQDVAGGVWPDAWLATLMTGSLLSEACCLLLVVCVFLFSFFRFWGFLCWLLFVFRGYCLVCAAYYLWCFDCCFMSVAVTKNNRTIQTSTHQTNKTYIQQKHIEQQHANKKHIEQQTIAQNINTKSLTEIMDSMRTHEERTKHKQGARANNNTSGTHRTARDQANKQSNKKPSRTTQTKQQ